jgi:flagellar biosynthesis anti-sigma factor FlgM
VDKNKTTENQEKIAKSVPPGGSQVEISDEAKMMQKAGQIAKESVVNSPEKLADLKRRIQDGTYHVEAGALADKIIEEHFGAHLGKNSL